MVESCSHYQDGGGLGPYLRNLEGNPPTRGPTTGETDKEGWIGVYEQLGLCAIASHGMYESKAHLNSESIVQLIRKMSGLSLGIFSIFPKT